MSESWPGADEVTALFRGVCAGDPLALADFLAAVLDPLVSHLHRCRRDADEHACLTAAADAVLALVHNPAIYDPARRGLIGFLCMAAEGDLANGLAKEARHHRNREKSEVVELAPDRRNTLVEDLAGDLPSFDDPRLVAAIARFTATERAVFELMRAGEKATAAFAAALDLGQLPTDEQAREAKRVKDRIIKRLQRAGEAS